MSDLKVGDRYCRRGSLSDVVEIKKLTDDFLRYETPVEIPGWRTEGVCGFKYFHDNFFKLEEGNTDDPANPDHYKGDDVMCIIERYGLNFRMGNVAKYVLRHKDKGGIEDLRKAHWYLSREIEKYERES